MYCSMASCLLRVFLAPIHIGPGLFISTTARSPLHDRPEPKPYEEGCAGLRNARAKGKRLGRPRVYVNPARITALRARGASWREISDETGISKGTAQRALPGLPKIVCLWAATFSNLNPI